MIKKLTAITVICLLVIFLFQTTTESIMSEFSLEELCVGARSIVLGNVKHIRYRNYRQYVLTYITFTVEKYLKYYLGKEEVVLYYPGGYYSEELNQEVEDAPKFEDGERAIVFMRDEPQDQTAVSIINIYAWNQGKFTVDEKDMVLDPFNKFGTEEGQIPLADAILKIKEYTRK